MFQTSFPRRLPDLRLRCKSTVAPKAKTMDIFHVTSIYSPRDKSIYIYTLRASFNGLSFSLSAREITIQLGRGMNS